MLRSIRENLSSDSLVRRIATGLATVLIVFILVTIVSHYALPNGVLRGKNPMQNWDESPYTFRLTLQIFLFNMISVVFIVIGSMFGSRAEGERNYYSVGYTVMLAQTLINAVTLGTWSFGIAREEPSLVGRLLGVFNIAERAAIWEMTGQLLITAALAHIALVRTSGKQTSTRSLRDVRLTSGEKIALALGLVLMLIGAAIEAIAINN